MEFEENDDDVDLGAILNGMMGDDDDNNNNEQDVESEDDRFMDDLLFKSDLGGVLARKMDDFPTVDDLVKMAQRFEYNKSVSSCSVSSSNSSSLEVTVTDAPVEDVLSLSSSSSSSSTSSLNEKDIENDKEISYHRRRPIPIDNLVRRKSFDSTISGDDYHSESSGTIHTDESEFYPSNERLACGKRKFASSVTSNSKFVPISSATTTTTTTMLTISKSATSSGKRNNNYSEIEDKRERRRIRNRELAAESRERRKLQIHALARENAELRARLSKYEPVQSSLGDLPMFLDQLSDPSAPKGSAKRVKRPSLKVAGAASLCVTAVVYSDSLQTQSGVSMESSSSSMAPFAAFWVILSEISVEDAMLSMMFSLFCFCFFLILQRCHFGSFSTSLASSSSLISPSSNSISLATLPFVTFGQGITDSVKRFLKPKNMTYSM